MKGILTIIFLIVLAPWSWVRAQCDIPFPRPAEEISLHTARISWIDLNDPMSDAVQIELTPYGEIQSGNPDTTFYHAESGVISGLPEATHFAFRLRGICGSDTSAWSVSRSFTTHFSISPSCNLEIPLRDNSCNSVEDEFFIEIDSNYSGILGEQIFIHSLELSLTHTWPSDLKIVLEAPTGQSVILLNHNGFGQTHLGTPGGVPCAETALLNDLACQSVEDNIPLTGSLRPFESFASLYDQDILIQGTWKLKICDRAQDDKGNSSVLSIQFTRSTMSCPQHT